MRFLLLAALALIPAPQDEDLTTFTSKEGNFRVRYPRTFKKVQPNQASSIMSCRNSILSSTNSSDSSASTTHEIPVNASAPAAQIASVHTWP